MDIPRRKKKTIKLPEDCELLDVSICEHPKVAGRCKIERARFGGNDTCKANQEYLLQKEIYDQGFKDFAQLDTDNIEEELGKREELCSKLSKNDCMGTTARIFGCQYVGGVFKKGRCKLADKIIRFYYDKDLFCMIPGCGERKEAGFKLCEEHREEFDRVLEGLIENYTSIMNKEDVDNNYLEFVEKYDYLTGFFNVYLIQQPATLIQIAEKYNNIRQALGEDKCQCINVTGCVGKGKIGENCQNKGIRSDVGMICAAHKKCFKKEKLKFEEFKGKFQNLCSIKSCKKELEDLKKFYKMLIFCTEGETFIMKTKLLDYIYIIDKYISEVKKV